VTAVIAGFVIGALSGAPFQISGPTGAMSAVLIVLAQKYGEERFCAAALLTTTVLSFFTISLGLWWLRQHPAWLGG
jgi:SulP family sulfate permease